MTGGDDANPVKRPADVQPGKLHASIPLHRVDHVEDALNVIEVDLAQIPLYALENLADAATGGGKRARAQFRHREQDRDAGARGG